MVEGEAWEASQHSLIWAVGTAPLGPRSPRSAGRRYMSNLTASRAEILQNQDSKVELASV